MHHYFLNYNVFRPFILSYNFIFSGSNKVEDAIECYQRAGNMFKMSKNWAKAGECFCEVANLHSRAASRHDAGVAYVDASNCYKKVCTYKSTKWRILLMKLITIYRLMLRALSRAC